MKKVSIFTLIILIGFISFISTTLATSGACSYHDGANCSAGPDWDGSVICNDGWRDSSVSFSQMNECKGVKHSCTTEQFNQLSQKYNIDGQFAEIQRLTNLMMSIGTTDPTRVLSLGAEVSAKQANLKISMAQVDRDCYALGDDRYYKEQADFYSSLAESRNPSCTENAYFDVNSGTCKCSSGYGAVGAQCVQLDTSCKATYGGKAEGVSGTGQCKCSSGNVWNDSRTSCISGLEWCKSRIGGDVIFNQITQRCECSSDLEFNGSSCVKTAKNTEQIIPRQPSVETSVQPLGNGEEKLENKYIPIEGVTTTSSITNSNPSTSAVEKKQGNFLQRVFQKTAGWFSKLWKK